LRVLITGATGAVGPVVVKAFHEEGHDVRTLSIDPVPSGSWPDDVESVIGDVTSTADVTEAVKGVDLVIHLAALLHIMNPPPALREEYERINVGGTSIVVREAVRAGVRRVVLFSTIAVYGLSHGSILTEEASPHPDTFYGSTKLAAERIVLEAGDCAGRPIGTILRLGAVYGPGIKGNYQRLVQSLARGRFLPVGDGSNRRTLVYDKDVSRAALLASVHSGAAGRIFNVSNGSFPTMKDIIETICSALGRRQPRFALPLSPVRWGAGVLEDSARLFGLTSPVTRSTIDKYTEDIAVSAERIKRELGFVPQYDLPTSWRETVEAMRETRVL